MSFLRNFIRFSRLHTVIGTTISILSLYFLALSFSGFQNWHLSVLLLTLVSCLGANIYIVGLNQITDIEIDRINKPYLPLASGAFTKQTAHFIIICSVLLSLLIAFYVGRYLLATVVLSLMLGTAYSLPPIRLKRFYFWAAFCIIAVRGLIVNLLLFLNFHFLINSQESIPLLIWLLTGTIFIYSIVIAWFKDMPDTEGDEEYSIMTLSIKVGVKKVAQVGIVFISITYLALMTLPFIVTLPVNRTIFILGHLLLLALFWQASRRVNLADQSSIFKYYQFIWILFFLEYFIFAGSAAAA